MISAGLLYLGLFALAASMSRHAELLPAHLGRAKQEHRLRFVAWLFIIASLVAALWSHDWPVRLIVWIGLAPLAAGIVLFGLSYGIRWARAAALSAVALILAGIASGGG